MMIATAILGMLLTQASYQDESFSDNKTKALLTSISNFVSLKIDDTKSYRKHCLNVETVWPKFILIRDF